MRTLGTEGRRPRRDRSAERAARGIQEKLDRLNEAFLFDSSINIETYDRHAEKLREERTPDESTVTQSRSMNST